MQGLSCLYFVFTHWIGAGTLPAQLLIVLVSIGGTGEHKQLLLTEANAWTLPANSIPGPRQVPKSKTSVGSRTWGVLSKAHPVDLRECSVCVSLESDAYFEMSPSQSAALKLPMRLHWPELGSEAQKASTQRSQLAEAERKPSPSLALC